jgi:hypothetical protein
MYIAAEIAVERFFRKIGRVAIEETENVYKNNLKVG